MNQKPLLRWTVGPVSPLGFEILAHSVHCFKAINNDFDLMICHNQLNNSQLDFLKTLDVDLYCQDDYQHKFVFPPKSCGWKLYPPRLRPDAHEIIMDNDLVLFTDQFLRDFVTGDSFLITEALARRLGAFAKYVPAEIKMNTGLIGLPPGFDFESEISAIQIKSGQKQFESFFDEQGLVTAIISKYKYTLIALDKIWVCADQFRKTPFGAHFVKANRGYVEQWNAYRKLHENHLLHS